jgi:hypothetical protein
MCRVPYSMPRAMQHAEHHATCHVPCNIPSVMQHAKCHAARHGSCSTQRVLKLTHRTPHVKRRTAHTETTYMRMQRKTSAQAYQQTCRQTCEPQHTPCNPHAAYATRGKGRRCGNPAAVSSWGDPARASERERSACAHVCTYAYACVWTHVCTHVRVRIAYL